LKYLRYLLLFVPLAVVAELLGWSPLLIFVFSCIALVPLAGLLGEATEELAIHTGPKIGGLLNATLGNAAELIITIVALSQGQLDLVKASITGSILGNLLLILGASLFLGGWRHGIQKFDRTLAGVSATMMTLAVIGLIIPTLFELLHELQLGHLDVFNTNVNDPALNLRAQYAMFERTSGRPLCVGNGEHCRRMTSAGMQQLPCPTPAGCEVAQQGLAGLVFGLREERSGLKLLGLGVVPAC